MSEVDELKKRIHELEEVVWAVTHINIEKNLTDIIVKYQRERQELSDMLEATHSLFMPVVSDHPDYTRSWAGWSEAFAIFAQYSQDYDHVAAEHDIIYAGPPLSMVSEAHKARLEVLGWHEDGDLDCFYHYV